ncbi:septum site-determining protein MinC [Snodgrassella alvi]|uniref:septum site-determining protein MinC n=1 Tax=Snodgrassella TaxID=1193515 RepID=UPI000A04017C|nr:MULTISPECIES: septum site-determining protein MinC [Snodgrassella]MBI0068930.1 septum site-determining protein MinC [Snodgrassella sp. M0110]MBI0077931.1 septum site-determining protein MinC [Snodgrassella sp. M0118]MBI0080267.1 septum site-determining protein MinC [Snodgrassella sp. M0112]MBI0098677.1 septum site-determining protein MinC [Snodgrassella sp. W8134]MBI0102467.1 septum site-determining protein MinC [Snodgrassella sp. W8135]
MNAAFNVKSARLDTLSVQLLTDDLTLINQELKQRAERFGNLRNMPFTLDLQNLSNQANVNLAKLIALFARYNLRIIAIRHTDLSWSNLAKQHNIAFSILPEEQASARVKAVTEAQIPQITEKEKITSSASALPTLVIDRTIRTGQQVYAEKSDLIVLGLVSEGAEIIADGNIHIYGPLRGRALAGAAGNKDTRIFAQSMQAELVSVAGIYRIFDQQLPAHLYRHPVQIFLQNDRLVLSAIQAH